MPIDAERAGPPEVGQVEAGGGEAAQRGTRRNQQGHALGESRGFVGDAVAVDGGSAAPATM
jgi:hypothetical protein